MNEVEKHYAGQNPGSAGGSHDSTEPKSTLDHVASAAKDGVRSATEAAKAAAQSAKTVAGTARETAEDAYDKASSWGRDQYGQASRTVSDARRRSTAELARHRRGVEGFVEENPVMVGVVGLAAGLLLGALLPSTRRENQVFGRYADEVRDQGLRYARDLAQQGKQFVEENLDSVAKAARPDNEAASV